MSTLSTLNSHKTKLIGLAGVVIGVLQTSGQLEKLVDETTYGWITLILGVGTAVVGFLNTSQNQVPPNA